jgi:hypothetical protein
MMRRLGLGKMDSSPALRTVNGMAGLCIAIGDWTLDEEHTAIASRRERNASNARLRGALSYDRLVRIGCHRFPS